ncbi:MAG: lipoyl synthase [bacterium]|nr:lipoyl synthase [bacterium]
MKNEKKSKVLVQKPKWLRRQLPSGPDYEKVKGMIRGDRLHTVCQEAKCPNMWECFSQKTATFLILGSRCTRDCRFCSVLPGPLEPPDPEEPVRVADVAHQMGLKYVVVTSVTRDDVSDGGASLFAQTIIEIRNRMADAWVEVLIPDFQGNKDALKTVLKARPDVLNHNIETVPRLYPQVRPQAEYQRSLDILQWTYKYDSALPTKSGLMLGLGEEQKEVENALEDLRAANCRILTLGQYLQPSRNHLPVERFIPPEEFDEWRKKAIKIGFTEVASGPFVRSSYHAKELYQEVSV